MEGLPDPWPGNPFNRGRLFARRCLVGAKGHRAIGNQLAVLGLALGIFVEAVLDAIVLSSQLFPGIARCCLCFCRVRMLPLCNNAARDAGLDIGKRFGRSRTGPQFLAIALMELALTAGALCLGLGPVAELQAMLDGNPLFPAANG